MNFLEWYLRVVAYYFLTINSFYIFLFMLALISIRRREIIKPLLGDGKSYGFSPPVSIIVPAYNEEKSIVDSVHSLLRLKYGQIEVVVVNDGSKDGTFEVMKKICLLEPDEVVRMSDLGRAPVRGIYRSKIHPNLILIDKPNSGKADSLNVAIDYCSHDLVCAVDSDSVLNDDALLAISMPFTENPHTIASGGTIQLANGSTFKNSRPVDNRMPDGWLERVQIVEYIRSFFCGRVGLDVLGSTLVISGAFGIFRKDAVVAVRGYQADSMGEDMDLVVRMHRKYRDMNKKYSICFLPDPVCWTEAPSDLKTLQRQRRRWQVGLLQSLYENRRMMFNPKYGVIGMFAFPYNFIVDILGPFIELSAYIAITLGIMFGLVESDRIFTLVIASILYGMLISVGAVVIGELYYHRYTRLRDIGLLVVSTIFENFGYRQINSYWRMKALIDHFKGNHSWGEMKRTGFAKK
ncbi:glycosyltransferase [Bdellovibrio sp. SKB1291214]|uniref:glycosyltransferase family 2 protein n=1 Tax=Bdellovibrio sp. SKB1291214 TaxID=1732569 RepID=UPI000B518E01|nr:glycosyltransferase [Bdellovibrio sp. SKB1291214]UYL09426.1 glycosyltransferase [Bdellovibrio sp. SKB1291214]